MDQTSPSLEPSFSKLDDILCRGEHYPPVPAVYARALMMRCRLPVTVAAASSGATYPLVRPQH